MFYEVELRRLVVVEPHELGGPLHTQRAMLRRLIKDVQHDVGSEEHGFYVTVTTVEGVSEGKVRSGTGAVVFSVDFKCIVFNLTKNEVVEAEVTVVMQGGFFAACGPHVVFVPKSEMTGFHFNQGPSPEFSTWRDSTGSVIGLKSALRLKVVARKWNPNERAFTAAGSLNGDLLGALIVDDPVLDDEF